MSMNIIEQTKREYLEAVNQYEDNPQSIIDFSYHFIEDTMLEAMETILKKTKSSVCDGCRGKAVWLSECCDGSRNCPCQGRPFGQGQCDVCSGTGKKSVQDIINKYKQ